MIKRQRLRRVLASTVGFRKAVLIILGGVICFLIGTGLSFKLAILPLLEWLGRISRSALEMFVARQNIDDATHLVGGAFLFLGFYLMFLGARSAVRHFWETANPGMKSGIADLYVRRQQLALGPRIVALGGGTGLSTVLRGLKQHSSNITAIVTVTDDGGSSGRLIQEKNMIPPGDIRNCMVALADAEKTMTDLFQHRFQSDSGNLSGHSIGNLLIAALVDQAGGDFEKAVEIASDVLLIRGRVVPSTLSHVGLRGILENGKEIAGETAIVEAGSRIRRIFLDPADIPANAAAVEAIEDADLICIGPGSVFTSVIPNLLVPGIAQAIKASQAKKAYICNVMTQPGESDAFSASEHVSAVMANINERVFDYVVVNTGSPSPSALDKYRDSGQHLVDADADRIRAMGYRVVTGNFLNESDVVRHDPMRLASRLVGLVQP